jgi:hypothetical protein
MNSSETTSQPDDPSRADFFPSAAIEHHLRNKIGIVMGTVEILWRSETLSEEGEADLARIKRACTEMLALIAAPPSPEAPSPR